MTANLVVRMQYAWNCKEEEEEMHINNYTPQLIMKSGDIQLLLKKGLVSSRKIEPKINILHMMANCKIEDKCLLFPIQKNVTQFIC